MNPLTLQMFLGTLFGDAIKLLGTGTQILRNLSMLQMMVN